MKEEIVVQSNANDEEVSITELISQFRIHIEEQKRAMAERDLEFAKIKKQL